MIKIVRWVDLYSLILNELVERKCAHVTRFPPFYISSIGCHLFNLHNKAHYVYFEAGRVQDMRLPILMVAPPGFSKTFWLEQFLRGMQAILDESGIDIGFEGAMTEAGFVGTVRFIDGTPQVTAGCAKLYGDAIVGIEEFSALTEMMRAQYSKQLDTSLLGALDSGWVYKRLAAGHIRYETHITLWCGCQPARFDLTSGLGRRFLFVEFIPTKYDFYQLKQARRKSRNIRFNPVRTDRIRKELKILKHNIEQIDTVTFDSEIFKLFDANKMLHYEEMLFERLLLGYTIMRGRCDGSKVNVKLDPTSKQLLVRELGYRESIKRGSEFAEVLIILRENDGKMKLFELKEKLLMFGKDWTQSAQLISQLINMKAIKMSSTGEIILSPTLQAKKQKPWGQK